MTDPAVKHLVDVLVSDMRTRPSGGVERFLTRLAIDGGRKDYEEWAASPMTRTFLDLVKSLKDTVPLVESSDHAGLAKAFGCMTAFSMVERLIEDPTRVFPSIYDGAPALMARGTAEDVPVAEYSTSPEDENKEDK